MADLLAPTPRELFDFNAATPHSKTNSKKSLSLLGSDGIDTHDWASPKDLISGEQSDPYSQFHRHQ